MPTLAAAASLDHHHHSEVPEYELLLADTDASSLLELFSFDEHDATNAASSALANAIFASPLSASSSSSSYSPSSTCSPHHLSDADKAYLYDLRESSCNVGLLVASRDTDYAFDHSSLSPLTPSSPFDITPTTTTTTTTTMTPSNDAYSPDVYSSPFAVPPTPQCTPVYAAAAATTASPAVVAAAAVAADSTTTATTTTAAPAVGRKRKREPKNKSTSSAAVVELETTGVHAAKRRLAEQRRRGRLEKKALAHTPVLEREALLNSLARELLAAARAGDLARVRMTLHAASNTGDHQFDAEAHARLLGALDDTLGCTPLFYAVFYDHREVAEYLLAHGADANTRSRSGSTPLHWAVDKRRIDLLAPLARHHADPNQLDAQGLAVVHHAVKRADLPMLAALVSTFGAALDLDRESAHGSPLVLATDDDLPDVVSFLLDAGATLVAPELAVTQSCSTAIHHAAKLNRHRSLERLVRHHATTAVAINAVDSLGRTPLHYAAFFGKLEAADLLVAHGASLAMRDNRGLTPVDLAQRRSPHVYRRLVPSP